MTNIPQIDQCVDHGQMGDKPTYARVWHNGKRIGAHVRALMVATGTVPDGRCALHSCDNPRCINPTHLRWGTYTDNVRDMMERGRGVSGSAHPFALLTDATAVAIRAEYVPYSSTHGGRALAKKYGVHPSTVSLLITGRSYKEVATQ